MHKIYVNISVTNGACNTARTILLKIKMIGYIAFI